MREVSEKNGLANINEKLVAGLVAFNLRWDQSEMVLSLQQAKNSVNRSLKTIGSYVCPDVICCVRGPEELVLMN